MKRFSERIPRGPSATRFTLIELVMLMSCSALAFAFASRGLILLAVFFLATVIAFRTSIVDFTMVGGLAVFLTVVFGTVSIALLIVWSAAW